MYNFMYEIFATRATEKNIEVAAIKYFDNSRSSEGIRCGNNSYLRIIETVVRINVSYSRQGDFYGRHVVHYCRHNLSALRRAKIIDNIVAVTLVIFFFRASLSIKRRQTHYSCMLNIRDTRFSICTGIRCLGKICPEAISM